MLLALGGWIDVFPRGVMRVSTAMNGEKHLRVMMWKKAQQQQQQSVNYSIKIAFSTAAFASLPSAARHSSLDSRRCRCNLHLCISLSPEIDKKSWWKIIDGAPWKVGQWRCARFLFAFHFSTAELCAFIMTLRRRLKSSSSFRLSIKVAART